MGFYMFMCLVHQFLARSLGYLSFHLKEVFLTCLQKHFDPNDTCMFHLVTPFHLDSLVTYCNLYRKSVWNLQFHMNIINTGYNETV